MYWFYFFCTFLFIILILLFCGGYFLFKRIFMRRAERSPEFEAQFSKRKQELATRERLYENYEWFKKSPSTTLCIKSVDGLRLFGTLLNADTSSPKGVVMLFHGYRSSSARDFCFQMKILHDAGYHILAIDQRAHGRSEGKYICFGIKEKYDVVEWRKKVAELFGENMSVAIMGLSMGGATVLMSSSLFSVEDSGVKCIIADCPFSSAEKIITYVTKHHNHVPPFPFLLFAGFWCRMLAGFTLSSPSSAQSIKKSHLPALIFHGTADDYVPIEHSYEIAATVPLRVKLLTIDNAGHGECVYIDESKYRLKLLSFLSDNM